MVVSVLRALLIPVLQFTTLATASSYNHPHHDKPGFWLEQIKHQGVAAFNPDKDYVVFRNVQDFGAKGDGYHDDTAAINAAISAGNRCAPWNCQSSTTTAAVVYFPAGTYMVSSTIVDYYETQIVGNPNDVPTLKASKNFTAEVLIEGNSGNSWVAGNIFYRQMKNLVIDLRNVEPEKQVSAFNWPTAQATSLSNLEIWLSEEPGTQHQGIVILSGAGGFLSDIVIHGGSSAIVNAGGNPNVQNLQISNAITAVTVPFGLGAMYRDVKINNCSTGFNMSSIGLEGAMTFIDSSISNTEVAFLTSYNSSLASKSIGSSLILENLQFTTVDVVVQDVQGVALRGTRHQTTLQAWGQGHAYALHGPKRYQGLIAPNIRPHSLTDGSKYYQRSKPQYASTPLSQFLSVRDAGAKGDGIHDDTAVLQHIVLKAAEEGKIIFFDAGTYKITRTLYIPPKSRLIGESYPVILVAGSYFSDMNRPQIAIQIGKPGEIGAIEWSDMVVSTQGPAAGAILIEWNLAAHGTPSGMWDVHARIGGFTGSQLQLKQCPPTPQVKTPPAAPDPACIGAFMTMHVTKSARGLYMENIWLWTSDHDLDSANNDQVTVYSGRGLYVESPGPVWLFCLSVEHHSLYQYQLVEANDIFIGFAQSETPYYQPNPNATIPFPRVGWLNDPGFSDADQCTGNCADAWGLRVVDSSSFLYYTGGHFSYFDNYSTSCFSPGSSSDCQAQIVSLEGRLKNFNMYNLLTMGVVNMMTVDGIQVARFDDNLGSAAPSIISLIRGV
ncbi:glycoside hydrolase family 55 protein [Xylogone sp. PMI_703]|nr:glycoside hydrolase family 55 protein [Xylogone sp. PMI_703]